MDKYYKRVEKQIQQIKTQLYLAGLGVRMRRIRLIRDLAEVNSS